MSVLDYITGEIAKGSLWVHCASKEDGKSLTAKYANTDIVIDPVDVSEIAHIKDLARRSQKTFLVTVYLPVKVKIKAEKCNYTYTLNQLDDIILQHADLITTSIRLPDYTSPVFRFQNLSAQTQGQFVLLDRLYYVDDTSVEGDIPDTELTMDLKLH